MRRRAFIALLGGAALAWPRPVRAQPARTPTIGILVLARASLEPFLGDLRSGLRDRGYADGVNIRLEIRVADGRAELLAERAAELVRLKADIIVAFQTPACTAAQRATAEIPIVMVRAGDPVATGLVASYARPGGNITGTSAGVAETVGNLVALMHETFPSAQRFAALLNATDPFTQVLQQAGDAAARRFGTEMVLVLRQPSDPLEPSFEDLAGRRVTAVFGSLGAVLGRAEALAQMAMKYRLALFSTDAAVPRAGGLMSYAADFNALHRETAVYIDKILKGSRPADLAVSFPTKFEMVINLKTARTLGLAIPQAVLAQADEVIE
jgi:putative ABC transport system substrate-binding protein